MASLAEFAPSRQAPNRISTPRPLPPTVRRRLEGAVTVELHDLLFEGLGANPARPVLMATLDLDATAADFLAACIYWRLRMGREFYKFNAPCDNTDYQPGDSWLEELGIGETAFYRARQTVATKNVTGNALNDTLASTATSSLVIFWTVDSRHTWYDVRLDLLCEKLGHALGLLVTTPAHPARPFARGKWSDTNSRHNAGLSHPIPPHPIQPDTNESEVEPPSENTKEEEQVPNDSPPGFPRLLIKPRKPGVTYSILQINKEEEVETDTDPTITHTAERLQAAGVWEVPAWEIAYRAYDANLTPNETLALFHSHLHQLRQGGKRQRAPHEVIAMATARMQNLRLVAPEPAALARYQLHQEFHRANDEPPSTLLEEVSSGRRSTEHEGQTRADDSTPPPGTQHCQQWATILADVQLQMTRATFDSWMKSTQLIDVTGDTYTILAPNPYAVDWLANRLRKMLTRTVEHRVGHPVRLHFVTQARSGDDTKTE